MQLQINGANITTFRVEGLFDFYNRKLTLNDISTYAGSSGSGIFNVLGISFLVEDQQGVKLADIDFSDPTKFIAPSITRTFEIDLSQFPYSFLSQVYKIQCAIKDNTGNVSYTSPVYKKVCQPTGMNESGYVSGLFQVISDCPNNLLTVKDLTPFVYSNLAADSVSKSGTLYYPTGTIGQVAFTGTPFTNNAIYTGEYRINCTSVGTYDLGDDFYVLVSYITNNVFNVTCANKIADLICCIVEYQQLYLKNCNNAIGQNAKDTLDSISIPFLLGLTKEINGQDASIEAELIRKKLKCNCGGTGLLQNEMTPINPSASSIVLVGYGGTTVGSPTINGTTKTYPITTNVYQVAKSNSGDLGFSIAVDTATSNVVKYLVTFNYNAIATSVLNAIQQDPTLVTLLNSLIISSGGNVDLSGLDGKCVINVSNINYFLSQAINPGTKITALSTNTTDYAAPANLSASNAAAVQSWLNSLAIGTFVVTNGSNTIGIISLSNTNNLSSITFSDPAATVFFQKTNATLVSVLQAIVDYLCELTALQVALGNAITLWQVDYNGIAQSQAFGSNTTQAALNQGIADSIYNIVQVISTLTGVTCTKIRNAFSDDASAVFGASGRIYGTPDGATCISFTKEQLAAIVIDAINSSATIKAMFCAINCETPATCPEVSDINAAMEAPTTIGIYGLAWDNTPQASQVVTVRYKKTTDLSYTTATSSLSILPNGNIQGTTPFSIPGLTAGATYIIWIFNNCGGAGFYIQVTVPVIGVYSGSYAYGSILYTVCGNTPVTLYSATPFAIGVTMYTDIGMTTPITGQTYIVDPQTGEMYTINPITGVIETDTGLSCETGTANKVYLENDTAFMCGNTSLARWTNGVLGTGKVLYTDSSLSTPVTGYSYVLNRVDGKIYNLNSVTGIIGSFTGIVCSVYSSDFGLDNSEFTICEASPTTLYFSTTFAPGVTAYTNVGLTIPVTGFSYISDGSVIYNINPVTGVVGAATGNACNGQIEYP